MFLLKKKVIILGKKICMVSLGCSKNLVNSEKMLAEYAKRGETFVNDPSEADEIIVNTCCFIDDATEESIDMIREMGKYKGKLLVSGCMVERFGDEIFDVLPEVDGIIRDQRPDVGGQRILSTPKGCAYLKIAEGCDNACTFCVIPEIKGKYISFPYGEILSEAQKLAKQGVKELIVIAQDTTAYDDDGYKLEDLLKDLTKIDGIEWIRLHYCYPERISDELIKVIKKEDKILNYIDVPIQHCNNDILRRMGRDSSKENLVELIGKLRKEIPDIVIRTSLMVGFPGETQEQFQELCDFVYDMKFERAGVFEFSPQEGTAAYALDGQIDEEEKHKRFQMLMAMQEHIAGEMSKAKIGEVIDVIVQGKDVDGNLIGRSKADSLDIDGVVQMTDGRGQRSAGDIVKVKIIEASGYDLVGVINY